MYFYLHFIFTKISSWLYLLFEWCWPLVKLRAFQCPHNCLTNRNFESKICKTVKNEGEVRKFSFSEEKVALFWSSQKIFIFKVLTFIGGGSCLSAYYGAERGTKWWGDFTQVERRSYFHIYGEHPVGGCSPFMGGENPPNWATL